MVGEGILLKECRWLSEEKTEKVELFSSFCCIIHETS